MQYFNPHEIKNKNKEIIRRKLIHHTGKNISDSFAINLTTNYIIQSNLDENCNILDLGPASGNFANQLYEAGYKNIYGVDIDDYLSPDNRPLITEFKTADLSFDKIPWPDVSFDVITAWCVLPHLENPFHATREIYRILKPDGIFIFTAPNISSKASVSYFKKNNDFGSYHANNNHLVIFTPALIEKTILKYFNILTIKNHIRHKIFNRGIKGLIRKTIYKLAQKTSKKMGIKIEKRWAYNTTYVLKKKDLADNFN